MNIIVDLNLRSTLVNQDNKCLDCGKKIHEFDQVYFRMDQAVNLYEVYCYKCGLKFVEIDKDRVSL